MTESAPPVLRVITRQELESGEVYLQWEDPDNLARPTPQKRDAIIMNPFSQPEDPA